MTIYEEALYNPVNKMTVWEVRQPLPQSLFSEPLYKRDMAGGANHRTTHRSRLMDVPFAGLIYLRC